MTQADDYQRRAKGIVRNYVQRTVLQHESEDSKPDFHVNVVWFCKTLQNWKALLVTTIEDNLYYEITYDGDKEIAYLDVYFKYEHNSIGIHANPTRENQ